jgi:hypothetical protein
MPAHEKQMEDHYRQAEVIEIGGPNDTPERNPLEFWWRKGLDADVTEEPAFRCIHLEAIAIDESDSRVLGDQDRAMIYVAYHAIGVVYGREGLGYVRSCMN